MDIRPVQTAPTKFRYDLMDKNTVVASVYDPQAIEVVAASHEIYALLKQAYGWIAIYASAGPLQPYWMRWLEDAKVVLSECERHK